jgi:hypothetical protein
VKTNRIIPAAAALLLSIFNAQFSTCFAQGSLTPLGAPAPTMKSLDQIEARTAITNTASLVTISQPGSYYLTQNLTVSAGDAIDIAANDVTLDLNGFTISSTAASAAGCGINFVSFKGNSDITISNGHIKGGVTNNAGVYSGPGFAFGIYKSFSYPVNVRVTGVSVSGCLNYGILLGTGNSSVVESCTVQTIGNTGIDASAVSHSTANQCGSYAIYADIATDCYGYATGSGIGLTASTANNCYGYSNGFGDGLDASTANNCYGYSANRTGLSATTANNCYGYSANDTGLSATTANSCYGYAAAGSGDGLDATTAQNCYGYSGSGSVGNGLFATTAQNCYGSSSGTDAVGLHADTANNCEGYNSGAGTNGIGLIAFDIATGCYGYSTSGTGLQAIVIANVCHGATSTGTALTTPHNVNSF